MTARAGEAPPHGLRFEQFVRNAQRLGVSREPVMIRVEVEPRVESAFHVLSKQRCDPIHLRALQIPDPQAQRQGGEDLQFDKVADRTAGGGLVDRLHPNAERFRNVVGGDGACVEVRGRPQYRASRRWRITVLLNGSPRTVIEARNSVRSGASVALRSGGTRRATRLPRRRILISSPAAARSTSCRRFARSSLTLTSVIVAVSLTLIRVRIQCTPSGYGGHLNLAQSLSRAREART
jgi:putative component of membrane protein insertase Oxa1/YidC/SpoIIIJ protein YidD